VAGGVWISTAPSTSGSPNPHTIHEAKPRQDRIFEDYVNVDV
jgi:hypothetical protein